VKYDDIAAIFLGPLAEPIPEPDVAPTAARRLRDALEPIATQGWWSPPAGKRFDALGLDFLPGYVWGRAAALGTPSSAVVVSAFGVFEPGMLASVYEAGTALVARDDILDARAAAASEELDAIATAEECSTVADPLLRVLDDLDGLGRPLFSALRALPRPTSPGGRIWRAAELVREHRGDGHLAALVGAGLTAAEANVLTERWLGFEFGEYSSTRGFAPHAIEAAAAGLDRRGWMTGHDLTDAGRAARSAIEVATDASQAALVDGCGDDLDEIIALAATVSTRLVDAHSFPADPRKRAGG
jgi:hypothetical protein